MRMTKLILAAAVALSAPASAAELVLRSGPARTRLIELFTSEGCSSCPPADERMNALAKDETLWKAFVPVAFHVTYWDYIGWKDPYADPAYDARQRAEAAAWGAKSTYTPGFVLDGEEWRGWDGAPPPSAEKAGTLTATAGRARVAVAFSPAAGGGPFEAFAVRLGFDIVSTVTAGENSGRTLRHEFVARGLSRAAMTKGPKGSWSATLPLPGAFGAAARAEGLAVWVAGPDGKPVQAAGDYLPLVSGK